MQHQSLESRINIPSQSLNQPIPSRAGKWKRRFLILAALWLASAILMSIPVVRALAIQPLYVHHPDSSGDIAYVMADGHAYWERLRAASDLYHENQVQRVLILDEHEAAGFNFGRNQVDSRVQRAIDHLELFGVPNDKVESIPINTSTPFSSLNEALGLKEHYPNLKRIVVVTSAPHTRRSLLCFRRTLTDMASVQVYSASRPVDSAELSAPIWMEYAKLLVYSFVA